MKRLTSLILGLSLYATGALANSDTFSSFYPESENDTPNYLMSKIDLNINQKTLAKSSISDKTLSYLYPEKDNDSPNYNIDNAMDNEVKRTHKIAISGIKQCVLDSIYPESDTDSPRVAVSC